MNGAFPVPARLVSLLSDAVGEEAAGAWLERLPREIRDACAHWSLEPEDPFDDLSYAWVAPVRRPDGSRAVLKVAWPDPETAVGIAALEAFAGSGSVSLHAAEPDRHWMLLEHLRPGRSIAELDEGASAGAFAHVTRALHRPVPSGPRLPSVADWWRRGRVLLGTKREAGSGSLPAPLLVRAEALFAELDGSAPTPPVLLHGDLHHRNILSAERDPWLAIDPKGVIGEPAFEVGAWLRNPVPELFETDDLSALLGARLDRISAETGLDRSRIRDWGCVGTVLSAIWALGGESRMLEHLVDCARILADPDL